MANWKIRRRLWIQSQGKYNLWYSFANFLFILKQTKNLSASQNLFLNEMQSFLKDIQLLPFQEWHSEMSHNQILTKLQFQKNYQCPLCCVAVWFRMNISAQHFLLCQLWFVIFQSTRFKKGNALLILAILFKWKTLGMFQKLFTTLH